MEYVQTAQRYLQQKAYEDMTITNADTDNFVALAQLTASQIRAAIKTGFTDQITSATLYGPLTATLALGSSGVADESIQLQVLVNRNNGLPAIDETANAVWLTNPTPSTVVTIVKGLVTANVAGTVDVYAKVGNIETNRITITVA